MPEIACMILKSEFGYREVREMRVIEISSGKNCVVSTNLQITDETKEALLGDVFPDWKDQKEAHLLIRYQESKREKVNRWILYGNRKKNILCGTFWIFLDGDTDINALIKYFDSKKVKAII